MSTKPPLPNNPSEPRAPYQGSDPRTFPWLTAYLQNKFTFKSDVGPPSLRLEWLGIRIYFPFRGKYWCARIHILRYDPYAKAYIAPFSSMFKAVSPTDPMP